jgi:multicomponent Na+:H+ antiporter subunit G
VTRLVYILIALGVLFNIFGCIGLVRFPDVYNRLQASTKCVTLGTVLLLVGCGRRQRHGRDGCQGDICAVFVFVTSPTAAPPSPKGLCLRRPVVEGTVVDKIRRASQTAEAMIPRWIVGTGVQTCICQSCES